MMTNTRNKLPVAVDAVSGGDASPRVGGSVIAISELASGSIALGTARRFRVFPNCRSWSNRIFVLGYTTPMNLGSAEYAVTSSVEIRDTVPANTTLYWAVLDATSLQPVTGGLNDYLAVTRYE
jgi:hypothetical protein